MAIPFVLGLVIGGGAVYAYNNREELSKQLKAKSKELKAGLEKGQETFDKVSTSIKSGAKNLTKNIKSSVSNLQASVKPAQTKPTQSSANKTTQHTKTTKSTKPKSVKTATKPTKKVAQTTTQPTLIANSPTI